MGTPLSYHSNQSSTGRSPQTITCQCRRIYNFKNQLQSQSMYKIKRTRRRSFLGLNQGDRLRSTLLMVGLMSSLITQSVVAQQPTLLDVEYARIGERPLRLDLYQPETSPDKSTLVVWIHGGAWRSGTKETVPVKHWLKHGLTLASVDYRLSGEAKFPAQIHDIKAAIRFLRSRADDFHIDPERIVVAGSSAGGHLAALVGVSNGVSELEGSVGKKNQYRSDVAACVSFYGASNLRSILSQSTAHGLSVRVPALQLLLGGQPDEEAALAELASPITHVDASDPPLWLIHGDADPQMPMQQSSELDAAYRTNQLAVRFDVIAGGEHGGKEFYTDQRLSSIADELQQMLKKR